MIMACLLTYGDNVILLSMTVRLSISISNEYIWSHVRSKNNNKAIFSNMYFGEARSS